MAAVEDVLVREPVIDSRHELVGVAGAAAAVKVIEPRVAGAGVRRVARAIGFRPQCPLDNPGGHRIEPAQGEAVVLKGGAQVAARGQQRRRAGVVNLVGPHRPAGGVRSGHRPQVARKIPGLQRRRRHRSAIHAGRNLPPPDVVGKEEGPVLEDRAAQRGAEFVADQRCRDELALPVHEKRVALEQAPGLHGAVAVKLVQDPVKLVRPRLGDDVDLPAGALAELGGVIVDLDLELLNGRNGRRERDPRVPLVGVGDPVELEGVLLRPRSPDRDAAAASRAWLSGVDPGDQQRQLHETLAVQRQLVDLLVVDDGAQRGALGVEQLLGPGHLHLLGNLAQLQPEVQTGALVHLDAKLPGGVPPESGHLDGDVVTAGTQPRQAVVAGLVGDGVAGKARDAVADRDPGALNGRPAGVGHGPGNGSGAGLAKRQRRRQQHRQERNSELVSSRHLHTLIPLTASFYAGDQPFTTLARAGLIE